MDTEQAKTAIKKQYSATEIKNQSLAEDMKTMKMDGIGKVFQGIASLHYLLPQSQRATKILHITSTNPQYILGENRSGIAVGHE